MSYFDFSKPSASTEQAFGGSIYSQRNFSPVPAHVTTATPAPAPAPQQMDGVQATPSHLTDPNALFRQQIERQAGRQAQTPMAFAQTPGLMGPAQIKSRPRLHLGMSEMRLDAAQTPGASTPRSKDSETGRKRSLSPPDGSGMMSPLRIATTGLSQFSFNSPEPRRKRAESIANSNSSRSSPVPTQVVRPAQSTPSSIAPLMPSELKEYVQSSRFGKTIVLDVRSYALFSRTRVRGAINVCIPTTLLKRPTFTVAKLGETLASDAEKKTFANWREADNIIVYDADSVAWPEMGPVVQTAKKFGLEGWQGRLYAVKGGFAAIERECSKVLDHEAPEQSTGSPGGLHLSARGQSMNAAGGGAFACALPAAQSVVNPFFSNIRQNMDLMNGVGDAIAIRIPQDADPTKIAALPKWLHRVAFEEGGASLVAERFYKVEKLEQKRLQSVLNTQGSKTPGHGESRARSHWSISSAMEQGTRNRYNNIWPYDHSRVKLNDVREGGTDYVNASFVENHANHRRYIATQGPLPATSEDFWRVCWEQDVRAIVMLTTTEEGGQVKCHPYWKDKHHGPMYLNQISERKMESADFGPEIKGLPNGESAPIIIRQFTLAHGDYPFEPIREITQVQYTGWPDFGSAVPAALLAVVEQATVATARSTPVNSRSTSLSSLTDARATSHRREENPVVVHCSAGCGRTGTYCTIDSVVDLVKKSMHLAQAAPGEDVTPIPSDWEEGRHYDDADEEDWVYRTVKEFREDRLSMVQTLRQFVLCYETVLEAVLK
ncbi:phosphotyrosine-specific ptp2-like protein [Saitoella coloradoensis]